MKHASGRLGCNHLARCPVKTTCFFGGSERTKLKEQLKSKVASSRYGADHTGLERDEVLALTKGLSATAGRAWWSQISPMKSGNSSLQLDGRWQLEYTTEKSVHSIVRGLILGLSVSGISQNIDLREERVTNEISFSLFEASLKATGPLVQVSDTRIEYQFDAVLVGLLGLTVALPSAFVRGGGWTEAEYVDTDLRVMANSQGDTLVFVKSAGAEQTA